jgi:hypothetical protein
MANEKIKAALDKLDPANNNHWTENGLPRVETVRMLAGDPSITREQIATDFPEFKRPTNDAGAATQQNNGAEGGAPPAPTTSSTAAPTQDPAQTQAKPLDQQVNDSSTASQSAASAAPLIPAVPPAPPAADPNARPQEEFKADPNDRRSPAPVVIGQSQPVAVAIQGQSQMAPSAPTHEAGKADVNNVTPTGQVMQAAPSDAGMREDTKDLQGTFDEENQKLEKLRMEKRDADIAYNDQTAVVDKLRTQLDEQRRQSGQGSLHETIRGYLDVSQAEREARGEAWQRFKDAGLDLKQIVPRRAPIDEAAAQRRRKNPL